MQTNWSAQHSEALREYVPGFDSRYIDWKHSARHRKLVCKEFQIERNHPVIMAFDTGYLMLEPIDFGALYMQQAAQAQAEGGQVQAPEVTGQA